MLTPFSSLFFLKGSRSNSDDLVPVYLRITVAGKRSEVSIKKKIRVADWIIGAGKMKGRNEVARKFNFFLQTIQSRVYDAYLELVQDKQPVTAISLKNMLKGKPEIKRTLVAIFRKHNSQIAALVPKQYSAATLERYKTTLAHTIEFMKSDCGVEDVNIEAVDHQFVTGFDFFLRSSRQCCNNTTVKYIKNFKKIIRICIANGWLKKDPFINYTARIKEVYRPVLNDEGLRNMIDKKFSIERLNQVKDVFIFSCFTGLAYADVKKLNIYNISVGIDGKKWLFVTRAKTGTPCNIPLLPLAEDILARYANQTVRNSAGRLLPVLSNQKTNSYLKEIADLCGIKKELTFHCARYTFATTVTLNQDVPIETVSRVLGHKNLCTTQHYAKISDKKVSQDMHLLNIKSLGTF